jgi:hypothetical protein
MTRTIDSDLREIFAELRTVLRKHRVDPGSVIVVNDADAAFEGAPFAATIRYPGADGRTRTWTRTSREWRSRRW